ncbi:Transcription factor [Drechmeria coniospora]|uniref:Transcription factor n=1 Tax=Drechmeria coniospora TaxID=98403 RepID=A0A151GXW7_DRECN|nr:Transcription factor [Drechmeria coniospora]KYK61944.1 Transcription factor [Drechmeria coniospora]
MEPTTGHRRRVSRPAGLSPCQAALATPAWASGRLAGRSRGAERRGKSPTQGARLERRRRPSTTSTSALTHATRPLSRPRPPSPLLPPLLPLPPPPPHPSAVLLCRRRPLSGDAPRPTTSTVSAPRSRLSDVLVAFFFPSPRHARRATRRALASSRNPPEHFSRPGPEAERGVSRPPALSPAAPSCTQHHTRHHHHPAPHSAPPPSTTLGTTTQHHTRHHHPAPPPSTTTQHHPSIVVAVMSSGVVRSTALRAGGACVRCRKGKTKCVYENGRAPCKNCAKGMHECYLPSESMAHHHGQSPARHSNAHRAPRDSLPAPGAVGPDARLAAVGGGAGSARHVQAATEKLTPELIAECERVVSKTFPACVAFHKPSFVQQLKNASLESTLVYGLLTFAARSSPALIRRYGTPTQAAETFAAKAMVLINQNLDHPNLADIQALCLIIIHEWGTRNAVRAYIYLGQAARMLHMYRILNGHHASDTTDQFLREESFRRTLWLLYILDCLLTSTPGRFPALSVQDTASVPLPCTDLNFAFGNTVYTKTLLQQLNPAALSPTPLAQGDIGEFGQIVLAATIWRDVVGMLTATSLQDFSEEDCAGLIGKIEGLRTSLPMQFVDKPGQITLHMTMGSGYTFAMLHCLLHCSTVFVHRRRLLQEVTSPHFTVDAFNKNPKCHGIVDRLFASCHGTILLLDAVEAGADKEHATCFPIFMLFSAFTASATVAYLSLKGLTPANAAETAAHVVKDGLRFMQDGTENWPLMSSWLRHLTVMQRVLNNDAGGAGSGRSRHGSHPHGGLKDEVSSNADTNPDAMDYDQPGVGGHGSNPGARQASASESPRDDSEPPVTIPRRPGVTTINGSGGLSTPAAANTPPPGAPPAPMQAEEVKQQSPDVGTNGVMASQEGQTTSQDMTAPELCLAFERQLLDLDDLAAFMGGGV